MQWAEQKQADQQSLTVEPALKLLILGTAGTGKTHTVKAAIGKVRQIFGCFSSVLTVAFSGVAAANLGSGACTIDSIFHTNATDAASDLAGEKLDKLVETLREVKLIVIDKYLLWERHLLS